MASNISEALCLSLVIVYYRLSTFYMPSICFTPNSTYIPMILGLQKKERLRLKVTN